MIYVKTGTSSATCVAGTHANTCGTADQANYIANNTNAFSFKWEPNIHRLSIIVDSTNLGGIAYCSDHVLEFVWTNGRLQAYVDNIFVGNAV